MKMIRKGVFETNSSSCHSLTIDYGSSFVSFRPDPDNVIRVSVGEFGWEQETYNDVETKLAYILQYIRDWTGAHIEYDDKYQIISRTESDKGIQFKVVLDKLIQSHTGASHCELVPIESRWGNKTELSWGYIDHQSVEDGALDHLFSADYNDKLKNFIFNPHSYLETDNDNH